MCRKNLINQCYIKSDLCETKRKYPYLSGILNHEYQSEFFWSNPEYEMESHDRLDYNFWSELLENKS